MPKVTGTPEERKLRQVIQIAKRDLVMDDATYRVVLRAAGGADSTTAMRAPALRAVIEHLKKAGFQVRSKKGDRRQDTSREARKVRALWLFLHALGVVKSPEETALAKYVKKIAHVDDLRFAHGDAMLRLIETLKKWAMRFLPQKVEDLRLELVALRAERTFSAEEEGAMQHAFNRYRDFPSFDPYWEAWETFMRVLGRPVAGEVASELGGSAQ